MPMANRVALFNGQEWGDEDVNGGDLPTFRTVSESEFAAQCSTQQLWKILQEAEKFYLNEKYDDATPRLVWVSTMGSILGNLDRGADHV